MKKNIFVIDVDRCIGCMGCLVACKMENEVALGQGRNAVLTVGPNGSYPDVEMYFLPSMCQQCENPPCVKVCPTAACHKNPEDGVILIDTSRCVGCKSCKNACPYDAVNFNEEMRNMDKCTMCEQLRGAGESPACVKNCVGRALLAGDINDPESAVSAVLKNAGNDQVFSFRDSGNAPSNRYILRKAKWVEFPGKEK